ncbi:MAG: T9SS type A sorting domain-containing protein [Saprospiraceae bacterium]|nr:T9SS type A sorting domain-containing protein [Saprospiraceae bacterium]
MDCILFTFFSDDGIRLWINNELVIDHWIPQPVAESRGTIELEAGKKYDIKLEYFDNCCDAVCDLRWSTDRLPMETVPTSQLFPARESRIPSDQNYDIRVSPNPANSLLNLEIDSRIFDRVTWRIYDAKGREMGNGEGEVINTVNLFEINISKLSPGTYFIKIKGNIMDGQIKFVKH